jgi:ABC-type phosphate transport system substrate-binding protein
LNIFAHFKDVTEVQFALESEASHETLSSNEYTVIAVTSFCLGLMYIASVFLYIYLKKKKDQPSTATSQELNKSFSQDGENSSFLS